MVHDVLADRVDAVRVGEHRGEAPELAGQRLTVGVIEVELVGELVELRLQGLVVHLEDDRVRVQHDRDGRPVQQGPGHRVPVQHPARVGLLAEQGEGVGGEVPDRGAGHAEELRVRQRCAHLPGQGLRPGGLGAVRLVDHHDDVAPGRQVLAGVGELVDGRGDDAAHVVGQQGAQLLAGGGLVEVGVAPSRR